MYRSVPSVHTQRLHGTTHRVAGLQIIHTLRAGTEPVRCATTQHITAQRGAGQYLRRFVRVVRIRSAVIPSEACAGPRSHAAGVIPTAAHIQRSAVRHCALQRCRFGVHTAAAAAALRVGCAVVGGVQRLLLVVVGRVVRLLGRLCSE
jgi:hypothetical protein